MLLELRVESSLSSGFSQFANAEAIKLTENQCEVSDFLAVCSWTTVTMMFLQSGFSQFCVYKRGASD